MISLLAISLALLTAGASAQQFAGDPIQNSLPASPGSEITSFRVRDPSGSGAKLDLINYYSLSHNGQRVQTSAIQRAVVMLFGQNRNAGDYQGFVTSAIAKVASGGASVDNTAIMTPMYANQDDRGTAYPYVDPQGSTSSALVWQDDGWAYGANSIYPASSPKISSFDTLDAIVDYFKNNTAFPNMKEIVISGHSKGAQMAQRYAALTHVDSSSIPVTFWPANPNSMLWLSTNRPVNNNCAAYDDWNNGLSNYTSASQAYAQNLVAQGYDAVKANFQSKQIAWLRSTQDHGDTSDGCAPFAQGANRDERFLNFIKEFPPSCDSPSGGNCDTVDYVDSSHDASAAIGSPAGLARLFTDNFDGSGKRAYDFGSRRQDGDNPYPSP